MTQCCRKKNVGKPCEGEPHARFDEGRMKISSAYSTQKQVADLMCVSFFRADAGKEKHINMQGRGRHYARYP